MLIDGLLLADSSFISNTHVDSGIAFPSDATVGRVFYLSATNGSNDAGLYVYNGTTWVTGDITKIIAGAGLTGGGNAGDVTLAIDASVVPRLDSITTTQVPEGTRLYYLDSRARAAISASGDLSYDSTTGVITFTPSVLDGGTY